MAKLVRTFFAAINLDKIDYCEYFPGGVTTEETPTPLLEVKFSGDTDTTWIRGDNARLLWQAIKRNVGMRSVKPGVQFLDEGED